MSFFSKILSVLRTYDYRDRLISALSVAVFLLMLVKMIVFPYGLFGFGEMDIYTEGLVSRTGIQNLNPLFVDYNEADRDVSSLIFSGLMKYDPEKKAVVEDVATLSISEDKTEYIFKIRDGIKWHDGKPLTVEDVYFTFHDIILDVTFQNEILKTNFAGVIIELLDNDKIKFKLEKPNVFFISNFTVGILPKHILKDVAASDLLQNDFNKKPIGSGPYMVTDPVESFSDGRTQITLTNNPYYYEEPSEVKHLRFVAYPTMDRLVDQIDSVNGVPKVSGNYILDFINDERFELIPYELPQYTAVFMNMESALLKDNQKVRLALQKAVDKNELLGDSVDKIRIDTPLMELNQEDWEYQANVDQAQGALKDAGYTYDADDTEHMGIRYDGDENALQLRFIARLYGQGTYQYEETKNLVASLQKSWESIGVGIQVEFLDSDQFKEKVMSRDYDLLLVGQILGYNLDTYSYWHSTQASPMGQNLSNYKSFQVDSLIEAIRSTFDADEKAVKLAELAKKLKQDIPAIFLYRPVYYYAADNKLAGVNMEGVVFASDRFAKIKNFKFLR